MKEINKYNRLP